MRSARRMTWLVVAALGLAPWAAAQTVSQRCVDAVREQLPEESSVWVVAAHGKDGYTELSWRGASGRVGVCRMEADGRISDVAVTGHRPPPSPELTAEDEGFFEPYELTCGSEFGARKTCDVPPSAIVVMVEQLGEEDCIAGLTWGQDDEAIWVERGCRAVFRASPRPARIDPGSLSGEGQTAGAGEGMSHPRFRESRAQQQCRNAAASRGVRVKRFLGTRIEGDAVVVLMEAETYSQRQEVTCRYDPATDQALIAR